PRARTSPAQRASRRPSRGDSWLVPARSDEACINEVRTEEGWRRPRTAVTRRSVLHGVRRGKSPAAVVRPEPASRESAASVQYRSGLPTQAACALGVAFSPPPVRAILRVAQRSRRLPSPRARTAGEVGQQSGRVRAPPVGSHPLLPPPRIARPYPDAPPPQALVSE